MARVTVEDCAEVVPNRFELVALASQRARSISSGAPITLNRDNDKDTVVALREIADRTVTADLLRDALVKSSQEYGRRDVAEENDISSEAADEMLALQRGNASDDDAEGLLYGESDLDVDADD